MSLKLRIGRGLHENDPMDGKFVQAVIDQSHATWTIEQLGRAMARQLNVVDGELEIKEMVVLIQWKKGAP